MIPSPGIERPKNTNKNSSRIPSTKLKMRIIMYAVTVIGAKYRIPCKKNRASFFIVNSNFVNRIKYSVYWFVIGNIRQQKFQIWNESSPYLVIKSILQ